MSLLKQSRSSLTDISITYKGKKIQFNLGNAVRITEEAIQDELSTQASKYGFLLMAQKAMNSEWERLKHRRKQVYGQLYHRAKEMKGTNNRPFSDDMCKTWVEKHKKFMQISMQCIDVKDQADLLYACVRAFEQRKDLMQTISSNQRNEK